MYDYVLQCATIKTAPLSVGWASSANTDQFSYGEAPGVKTRLIELISSVRTLMRSKLRTVAPGIINIIKQRGSWELEFICRSQFLLNFAGFFRGGRFHYNTCYTLLALICPALKPNLPNF